MYVLILHVSMCACMCGHANGLVSWGVGDAQEVLEGGLKPGVRRAFSIDLHVSIDFSDFEEHSTSSEPNKRG